MTLFLWPTDDETIEGAGRALRVGRITCVGLVERCLAKIEEWEPKVKAWVVVDVERALDQARVLDRFLEDGLDLGPLHGIPIGVKDIIDVEGLPTAAGAARWSKGLAKADASVVATLRRVGAIVIGKTVTTPYAFLDPPPTRNPWNLERTPGGSSSGSAAAVATGMCLAAIGTQTVGSLTRPAAFCGIASWKPMRRRGPYRTGIVPLAESLDALGYMARSVEGLDRIADAIVRTDRDREIRCSVEHLMKERPIRIAWLRGRYFDDQSEPSMSAAMEDAARAWRAAGAEVVETEVPDDFDEVPAVVRTILAVDAAIVHGRRFADDPDDYPPRISELIREGLTIKATDYIESTRLRGDYARLNQQRADWHHLWGYADEPDVDVVLCPAAPGPAPGVETTGNAVFNAPWNLMDVPTVSFPIGLSPDGLPLAAQLVRPYERDDWLLAVARWCERVIASQAIPDQG